MHWFNFPLVKATLFYVAGIALAPFFTITISNLLHVLFFAVGFAFLLFVFWRKSIRPRIGFGILVLVLFSLLGILNHKSRSPINQPNHYSQFVIENKPELIEIKISKPLKSTAYYDQYRVKIKSVDHQPSSGITLLQIKKDSSCAPLSIGQIVLTRTYFKAIDWAKNPHQFDYKNYLQSQHIYHKITVARPALIVLKSEQKNPVFWAHYAQQKYTAILDSKIQNHKAASVLKALLVGHKSDLDPTVKESFANAGVLHLLAVSGLHVGIVLLLVQRLLSFLKRLKYGPILLLLNSLIALWSFAAITGFSASVVRAAFMFSLFAIGKQLNRGHNSINTLFISMLVMLCIDPFLFYQVGFRLSYAAVFFILLLYPKIVALWVPKQYVLRKIWQLCCVSVSAQLGVMPLSLYYFHEFPTFFLISNLFLVPMIGALLSLGFVLCSFQLFIRVPDWPFDILNAWVVKINDFALAISTIDVAVIESIYLSKGQVIALFVAILACQITIHYSKKYTLRTFCSCWCIFLICTWLTHVNRPKEDLLVLYSFGQSILSYKNNSNLIVFSDTIPANTFAFKDYKTANGIKEHKTTMLPRYFKFKGNNILILNKYATLPIDSLKTNVLILTDNANINLDRWLATLQPKLVICDGSNYKNVTARWQKSTSKYGAEFYNTAITGAYRFKNNE